MDAKRKAQRARIKAYEKARAKYNLSIMRLPDFWKWVKRKYPEELGKTGKLAKWSKEISKQKKGA